MNLLENQRAADIPAGIFQDLEELLMANIIRHCKDYDQPIATDAWLMKKLAEIGKLNQENIRIIAKSTGLSQAAMEWMLNEMAEQALREVEPAMVHLSRQGLAGAAVPVKQSKNVKQVMTGLTNQAKDTLNRCNTTMLYKARDAYKVFVTGFAAAATEIANKQEFLDTLNKYADAVVIGAESRQQAVRKCIREFNEKGIPAFIDKRGREWTPEAYVNMAMRNTAKNVADEVQSARCRDYGCNLIEISSHAGARPKCAKDQGKIYDLDNGSGYVEDANGKKIRYYPWNSSSYGEPDGILGINCTHHKFPFSPGESLQRYFPMEDMDANDRLYKETQIQRALERDVRKQKRECMLYDEIGDKGAFEEAAVKLKSKEAKLKHYVDGNDQLHRRKDREQVVGFDKRISAEAVGRAQGHYKEWAKSIGAESGPKNLAGYYNLKYNDSKESRLYKGYTKAVNKGDISPLVGYDNYKKVAAMAEKELVGVTTASGVKIKNVSVHLTDRIIGQQAAGDTPLPGKRMGVKLEDVKDALMNGEVGPIKERDDGRRGQQFINDKCKVSFNPDTKTVIQVSPRGGKK